MARTASPSATHWPDYYAVTAERPAWDTVRRAADAFEPIDQAAPPLAVDLGCGAGRDTRELLRRGWRVVAMDVTPQGIERLLELTPSEHLDRLQTHVGDLATYEIPACDLVNANLVLPFLPHQAYDAVWHRIRAALRPGGRLSAMLFGDRDESAHDPAMTCPSPAAIREQLDGLEVERWGEREEDGETALGEAHHFHLIEVVAVRPASPDGSAVG